MSPRRLVLLALVAAVLVPGAARAAMPVSLYPVRVPGLSPAERADLHSFLKAALASGARRGVLRPRPPHLLAPTCGELPAAPACLGRLARDGVILVARGERRHGIVLLSAALYDRNGARTREVRVVVDLVIENLRPVNDALAELESELDEDGTVAGAPKPPPVPPESLATRRLAATGGAGALRSAPPPTPPPAPVAAAPRPPPAAPKTLSSIPVIPLPPPPAALRGAKTAPIATQPLALGDPKAPAAATAPAKPVPSRLDVSAPADPPPVWKRQAGPFFSVVGGALLASGAAVALANRSLAHDLDTKRAAGTLTAADRASYDKVDRYNVLSTVLLAGGGVSAVAGTYLWITAPARPGDPALAVAGGRF